MPWTDELKFDEHGLIPVVAQEADTGEVLMLAYANAQALARTLESGRAHYWSRSRQALWQKGESSGHVQEVLEVRADCDGDAVLYRVRQTGPACHTLERSCFHRRAEARALEPAPEMGHVLHRVEEVVRQRDEERPEGSYTTYLFSAGIDKILKKLGEETTEVVIAAKNAAAAGRQEGAADAAELRGEVADLLFHLLVMLRERRIALAEVWAVLEQRYGAPARRGGAPPGERPPA